MAPLLDLPKLLAEYGVESAATLRAAGVEPTLFADEDNSIAFSAAGRLLAQAAADSGCTTIGLALGRRLGLDVLGVLGHPARFAPDVETALRALILHLHLHDRGAVPALWVRGGNALFGYSIYCADVPGTQQVYDCALAVCNNIVGELAGDGWQATEVRLFRDAPEQLAPYRQCFRAPLRFQAQQAAVVFPAADLKRPLPAADPVAYAEAMRRLESLDSRSGSRLADKVQRVLRQLFTTGDLDATHREGLARLFAIHPRTLNRRLRSEGTSFDALLTTTRYEIARHLLRDTGLPTIEIARRLGYSDSAAFGHAFRRWSGTTATAWRSNHAPT